MLRFAGRDDLETAEDGVGRREIEPEALGLQEREAEQVGAAHSSTGTAGGSPPQAAMNWLRNLVLATASFASLVSQRRPTVAKHAVRSLPAGLVWRHLKLSSAQVSRVFRLARTRVLAAFPRVVSHSSTDFGSVNGKIGVALGTTVGSGVGVAMPVGPVGSTVKVGVALRGRGAGRRRVRVGAVEVGVTVGVGLGVGQVKALQSALQQPPSAPTPLSQGSPAGGCRHRRRRRPGTALACR